MDDIKRTLEILDLNDKEIAIYLMLLQVGTSPASTLGDRTQIVRSTAQYTCQQLEKKGLIRMVQKGNVYLYTAEEPEKLLLLLDKQKRELESKEIRVGRIIGQLKGLMNPNAILPKIKFFEGRDGILEGYRHVMDSVGKGEELLSYLHALEELEDEWNLNKPFADVTKALEKKGIRCKLICPRSVYAQEWQKLDRPPLRVTRLCDPPDGLSPTEVIIFRDSLFAITLERSQLFAYIVENRSITSMHRHMFHQLWNRLQ